MCAKATNTIPESEAITWTADYRGKIPEGAVKAFLIPLSDLLEVTAEVVKKAEGGSPMVRAYLAYDASKDEEKLVIVGTTQDNSTLPTTYQDMLPSVDPTYKIWDFTEPCPPKCDNLSPLNGPVG